MKLRNKLILSCAALAAVATTAVSTTFAWYTSNTVVTAGPLTADTKNSGDDLLMIADGYSATKDAQNKVTAVSEKTDATLEWTTSITEINMLPTELLPVAYNGKVKGATYNEVEAATDTAGALVDLTANYTAVTTGATFNANETYYTRSGSAEPYTYTKANITQTNFVADGTLYTAKSVTSSATSDASTKILHFVLYLKNAGTTDKYVKMAVTGLATKAATALPSKSIIDPSNNRGYMGLSGSETSYKVDALRVMGLDVEISSVADGDIANMTAANETVYDLKSADSALTFHDTITGEYSAHSYYNAIMATDLDTTDQYNQNTTEFQSLGSTSGVRINAQVPAAAEDNDYIRLDFKLFLNGWDTACFDACQGQAVSFGLKFEIDSNQS
jgi:hypothetical protein